MELVRTKRFAVLERADAGSGGLCLPRVAAAEVDGARSLSLLRERGYVVVTALGDELEGLIAAQEAAFLRFFERSDARKAKCVGTVYANERGMPMFARGYERQEQVRECFRSQACAPEQQPWPSKDARASWVRLARACEALAGATKGCFHCQLPTLSLWAMIFFRRSIHLSRP